MIAREMNKKKYSEFHFFFYFLENIFASRDFEIRSFRLNHIENITQSKLYYKSYLSNFIAWLYLKRNLLPDPSKTYRY